MDPGYLLLASLGREGSPAFHLGLVQEERAGVKPAAGRWFPRFIPGAQGKRGLKAPPVIGRFWFSPHGWGWTEILEQGDSSLFVFPTRVGMVFTHIPLPRASHSKLGERGGVPSRAQIGCGWGAG